MKVAGKVSSYIVDRRKRFAAGALVAVLAFFGLRIATDTGTERDPDRELVLLISTAMDRGQAFYAQQFPDYRAIDVVIFEDSTKTACGLGMTSAGPFYCEGDNTAYVDLAFFRAVHGELARAYVIAHELGHAVQHKLNRTKWRPSIAIELEADCLAGMWAHDEQLAGNLDASDVPGALATAADVGDDRLCPSCSVDRFRHGTSAQRVASFTRGLSGTPCW